MRRTRFGVGLMPIVRQDPPWCPGGGGQFVRTSDPRDRKVTRCAHCNKRLLPAELHCIGGEMLGYYIPEHKPKVKLKRPRPKGDKPARRV